MLTSLALAPTLGEGPWVLATLVGDPHGCGGGARAPLAGLAGMARDRGARTCPGARHHVDIRQRCGPLRRHPRCRRVVRLHHPRR